MSRLQLEAKRRMTSNITTIKPMLTVLGTVEIRMFNMHTIITINRNLGVINHSRK